MWGDGRSLVVLVVRTQRLHHCSPGSVPSLGTQIPHQATAGRGQKKKKGRGGGRLGKHLQVVHSYPSSHQACGCLGLSQEPGKEVGQGPTLQIEKARLGG